MAQKRELEFTVSVGYCFNIPYKCLKCHIYVAEDDIGIRLMVNDTSGIIEVRIRGEWRAVCDNAWSDVDAKVACRELGFPFDGKFCNSTS